MSRRSSRDRNVTIANDSALEIIREEQVSPYPSRAFEEVTRHSSAGTVKSRLSSFIDNGISITSEKYGSDEVEAILSTRETQLRAEFDEELKTQLNMLRERFDVVLQHEQLRSTYMLREALRERKEKVQALQTQLECRNMTGLMYVMCTERRKAKLEKLRIIEEYTKYIHTLQDILTEGQMLILHLSRGYKTAARVDHEWRQKMKSIIKEFQEYVYHFAGGTPESNQYVLDVPALLKTEASLVDDPDEDPCICEEDDSFEIGDVASRSSGLEEKTWLDMLDGPDRPFIMFGDMSDLLPPQRRQIVAQVKAAAAKGAPRKWKEYVFNEMFLKANCPRADVIKDEYPKHVPVDKWECTGNPKQDNDSNNSDRWDSRRNTNDRGGNMGSILQIITSSVVMPPKTNLLGARDSMEIASSTRIRDKKNGNPDTYKQVSICVARTRSSSEQNLPTEFIPGKDLDLPESIRKEKEKDRLTSLSSNLAEVEDSSVIMTSGKGVLPKPRCQAVGASCNSFMSSARPASGTTSNGSSDSPYRSVQDSLLVIPSHKPDADHKINYEKICPMEECQRMQVDSFMRSLPSYMRAHPYTLFEQTFAGYETCSPEQLEILKERLLSKRNVQVPDGDSLSSDFEQAVDGIAVQTSDELISGLGLPPCTCRDKNPFPSYASSTTRIFKVEDLIPMKEALDEITKECFYNQNILFDRFKVVGQQESRHDYSREDVKTNEEFKKLRVQEIKNILRRHPSMLDLFQPNPQC